MGIVPFDPKRAGRRKAVGFPAGGGAAGADRQAGSIFAPEIAADAGQNVREAKARIDSLERALMATLRENAANWARAERAEQLLKRGGRAGAEA